MSVESSRAFLQIAYDSPQLKQQLKAVTGTQEIVRLGLRYGYTFDVPELMEASSAFTGTPGRATRGSGAPGKARLASGGDRPGGAPRHARERTPTPGTDSSGPLHHEYRL